MIIVAAFRAVRVPTAGSPDKSMKDANKGTATRKLKHEIDGITLCGFMCCFLGDPKKHSDKHTK